MIRRRWPILLLILLPIALLAPVVLFGRVLYWGVPLLQFYPWQHAAVEALRSGQLPLWNPLVGSGAPLAANLQTGAFYPLNFLYLILPTEYAMSYTALLHVVLAGLFMYAFMRSLDLSLAASTLAAIAFQLCGFLIARLSFLSVTATFPWIAAWLWRTERLVGGMEDEGERMKDEGGGTPALALVRSARASARPSSLTHNVRDVVLLAIDVGLGVLAGHAQTAVYGLLLTATYFVWRVALLSRHLVTRLSRHYVTLSFAVAIVLGLGLAAIQLLPAIELTRESQRATGLESIKVLTHSYWPPRLLTLFVPDFFGNPAQDNFWGYDNYWENAAYIGVIPLLLALGVIWDWGSKIRKREANLQSPISNFQSRIPFFALVVFVSLVLAFGWFTPLYLFLYQNAPGFDLFQGPARWLAVTTPALCALAGFGAQRLFDDGITRRAAARWAMLGLALLLAGLGGSLILRGRVTTMGPATLRLGIVLIASGAVFHSGIRKPKSQLALIGIVAIDLITAHFALNPSIDPAIYHAVNPTAEAIKADGERGRVFYFNQDEEAIKFGKYLAHNKVFDGFGPNNLSYWLGVREAVIPNAAMIDGVPSANNFDSLIVGRYQSVLDQINALPLDRALPLLSRMNVAYVVSPRVFDLPVVYQTPDATIYRNDAALPRAWIAPLDSDLAADSSVMPGSLVEALTDSGNIVTIRAVSPRDGWLILSDVWYPGWQASVDGVPTEIQVANQAFRAIRFPAGTHQVEFRYALVSAAIGGWITLGCALVVMVGLAMSFKR